jgi:hypothetical protein
MATNNFFEINMPYGIVKNKKGEWFAFNRLYSPIGWNKSNTGQHYTSDDSYSDIPIRTKYSNATETILKQLIDEISAPEYDESRLMKKIYLYDESTNPTTHPEYWNTYLNKLKILSKLLF